MRILCVAPFPYGPHAHHGGGVAAWRQFTALAQAHTVGVLCFARVDAPAAETDYLRSRAAYFATAPLRVDPMRIVAARLASWLGLAPYGARLHRSKAMRAALAAGITAFGPDLVVLQFPQMAQFVDACGRIPCLIDTQDAFSVSAYRSYASGRGLLRRWARRREWLNWLGYEQRHLSRAAGVLTVTEQDLWGLRAYTPSLAGEVVGVPVDLPPAAAKRDDGGARIGFIGSFAHAPNVEAVRYFLAQVWPRVRAEVPAAEFVVAGASPPPELKAAAGKGVRFMGRVDDANAFLADCSAVAVPLLSGGGIKIKTLEALAAGAAVVATTIGAEGTGAVDGEHLLVRDNAEAFATALVALLRDETLRDRLGDAGRTLVAERFAPTAWRERFERAATRMIGNARA